MTVRQILIAIFLIIPLATFAVDFLYIATADLNVRTGAGIEHSVSFTLQKGDEVQVLSKNNSWYKIKYLGKTGYAHSKYLKQRSKSEEELHTPLQLLERLLIAAVISLTFFIFFYIYKRLRDKKLLESVTTSNRGTKTERNLVLKLLKYGIPAPTIFHDLYVKKYSGDFSQIDLVVVTEVGIIVFEVKDYSGWIFGSGNQSKWTQVLAYGKQKYRFYNPIKQNNSHVIELRKKLMPFGDIPFYSVVVFYGDCVFKEIDFVPNGTFLVKSDRVLKALKVILKDNMPVHNWNRDKVAQVLKEAVINGGSVENQNQHIENIKDQLGKHRIFD